MKNSLKLQAVLFASAIAFASNLSAMEHSVLVGCTGKEGRNCTYKSYDLVERGELNASVSQVNTKIDAQNAERINDIHILRQELASTKVVLANSDKSIENQFSKNLSRVIENLFITENGQATESGQRLRELIREIVKEEIAILNN